MRRRNLMSALAVVPPITSVVVLGGSASARKVPGPVTCTDLGGEVQSAPPGLSAAGATEAKKTPSKRHWTA